MANGFVPVRHLNGGNCFRSNPYQVDDSNDKDLFAGDAVTLTSGKVTKATTTTVTPILGIIKAVYSSTKNRPQTHNLPSTGNYVPASAAAYVDVYDDPDIVFSVVGDSAANLSDVGQVGDIVTGASGNPSTGISDMTLDSSTVVAEVSTNTETLPFKVIGLAKTELTGAFADGQRLEVVINNHMFRRSKT